MNVSKHCHSPVFRSLSWLMVLIVLCGSCDIKKNNEVKPETFVRIFNDKDLTKAYVPYDIKQTDDQGFIILGGTDIPESDFSGIYVMKSDKDGNLTSEKVLDAVYVNPVRGLLKSGAFFYFFCMDRLTLQAKLMSVDQAGNVTEVAGVNDAIYPLHASLNLDNNSFNLLHYNREDRKSELSRITLSGTVASRRSLNIGYGDFDAESSIIKHLTGAGKRLPFFCGQVNSNTYYFNGYYLYTLSTVFFGFNDNPVAVVQGYKDERYITSLVVLDGSSFAASRAGYGEYQFLPASLLSYNSGAVSSSSDMEGKVMRELESDSYIASDKMLLNGVNTVVYAGTTKSKQIALYFYEPGAGTLKGTMHLGFTNPYEAAAFTSTSEGGLAITGTTYIAGRFPRICLFKISAEELQEAMGGSQ